MTNCLYLGWPRLLGWSWYNQW